MELVHTETGEIVDLTNAKALDKISMKDLTPSPINPFLVPRDIKLRRRTRKVASFDASEVTLVSVHVENGTLIVNETVEQDEEHFVKLFRPAMIEAFDLTPTGRKVLDLVLKATEEGSIGSDVIYFSFVASKDGKQDGMSRQTWLRGTKELYFKGFIAPVLNKPNLFFINPHLFFKGDRVDLIKRFIKVNAERLITEPPAEQIEQPKWELLPAAQKGEK